MTDTLTDYDLSTGISDIISVDTLSLDSQSFKSISSKFISEINITFPSTEEITLNNKKKKGTVIYIIDKVVSVVSTIKYY
jgi:hypothetical protein